MGLMNITCPSCEMENAYLEIVDESGAHYICPDCDFEWCDSDNSAEEEVEEEIIKQFKECPNCTKAGSRFIYECNVCHFGGCYDEFNGEGCFEDDNHKVVCPKCTKCDYEIIGKIGTGWDEKFKN